MSAIVKKKIDQCPEWDLNSQPPAWKPELFIPPTTPMWQ